MKVIRVDARLAAGCLEGNLPFFLVDLHYLTHDPLALGDLVFHFAGAAVVQVKVIPPVPLGAPDDLAEAVEVFAVALLKNVHKRLRCLVDQCPRLAGGNLNLDHAMRPEPALDVLKKKTARVRPPGGTPGRERVLHQRGVGSEVTTVPPGKKHVNRLRRHRVARLAVAAGEVLGLQLVLRRGVHVVHLPHLDITALHQPDMLRVRRPKEGRLVTVRLRAVLGELDVRAVLQVVDEQIVILDKRPPAAVR